MSADPRCVCMWERVNISINILVTQIERVCETTQYRTKQDTTHNAIGVSVTRDNYFDGRTTFDWKTKRQFDQSIFNFLRLVKQPLELLQF